MIIGVLQHQYSPFKRPGLLAWLCDAWRESGYHVEMMIGIPRQDVDLDLDVLVPHVDLTVTPPEYIEFSNRFPVVVNRNITDISKRRFSHNLVGPDDDWTGEVIVKTDRNFGGIPERVIENTAAGRPLESEIVQRPWRKADQLLPANYPIFPSIREVPPGVWRNEGLIVEKFLPEREGDLYCNRIALVMGDVVLCRRVYSKSKVIKGNRIINSEVVDPPPGLQEIRARLGLDFGKIDFVVLDDGVHIFDVNKTPSGLNDPELDASIGKKLAEGIRSFLNA